MDGKALLRNALRKISLLLLATVFTVGLTFATLKLPYYVDEVLQNTVSTPDGDSHADDVSRLKTELFMDHYHVRGIGYAGFFILVGLIVAGFATRKSGLAAAGGVVVMLVAFAQFAVVMFFLAGLGVLNALWLPVLDISYGLQDWGLVIRAPNDLLRWVLGLFGVHSAFPTIVLFTGGGLLIFFLGVHAWLTARARGKPVADFWVYRFSRHPQYLGWIVWTYGAFLLIQLMRYPKRSWGIGASLPWLISTMVIIGVALLEELNMRRRHGDAYERYRRGAPFLFPAPRFVGWVVALPLRLLFRKEEFGRRREVAAVVTVWTVVLMGVSAFFYAGGVRATVARFASSEVREQRSRALAEELRREESGRRRDQLVQELASHGEVAVAPLVALLQDDDPRLRALGAEALGRVPSMAAVPALTAALSDSVRSVRYYAIGALLGAGRAVPREAVIPYLDDAERHVRLWALGILARSRDDVALERAPEFMADRSWWTRGAAAGALGVAGFDRAVPLVTERLADGHPWVRREAVLALLRIGSPAARPALEGVRADPDFEVRLYAAEALKRLPASGGTEPEG